jgi:TonB-linked SusC/RagA family outer membrane protein
VYFSPFSFLAERKGINNQFINLKACKFMKFLCRNWPKLKKLWAAKIFRMMRLTLYALILAIAQSYALSGYAQATKLNLNMENSTVREVLLEIENMSEFRFLYNSKMVDVDRTVSVEFNDLTIDKALDRLFKNTDAAYRIIDRQVVLFSKNEPVSENVLQQQRTVSGTVTDNSGQPLPGVTVVLKGTTKGTVTNADGNYSLSNIPEDATLVFSFVGMQAQEVEVGSQTIINIQLLTDVKSLDEVVVTAFGIERERRSLGYSVGTITGDAVSEVKDVNALNSLAGRVPGVSVKNLGTDAGSSVNVQIRGAKNFAQNGSQPLYVVDGVPIGGTINFNGASDRNVDYGNTSSDINADNIEKISVLKGANAAALYGSRAANGVILIETKTGIKAKKGVEANFTSSYMIDSPYLYPDFQYGFGQGLYGQFSANTMEAWGPRLDAGNKAVQYNSPVDEYGNKVPSELKSYRNNAQNFFQDALTFSNSLAITHRGENSNMRVSYNDLKYEGIIPNTDLKRHTFNLGGGFNASEKFRINLNLSFTQSHSENRPVDAYSKLNTIQLLYRELPPNININDLKKYWVPGKEGIQQFQTYGTGTNNPYFVVNENLNGFRNNRLIGTIELMYMLAPNLTIKSRLMGNFTDNKREERQAFSSEQFKNGYYSVNKGSFQELNADLMLGYHVKKGKDWYFSIDAGGNFMRQYSNSIGGSVSNGMVMPEVYTLSNYDSEGGYPGIGSGFSEKEIHSVLGLGQIAWRETFYLDITGRNDWSSTLPVKNNSYFYPSVSVSAILSDLIPVPAWLSLMKMRVGWAQVGSDTGPYQLSSSYSFGRDWNGVKNVSGSMVLPPFDLKPERLTSSEYGLDLALFKGRLGLEATYYETINENQIFAQFLSHSTGYAGKVINAGKIENKGWEIGVNLNPIKNKVRWDIGINYTSNKNKILELGPDDNEDSFLQLASTRGVKIYGFIGGSTSAIYTQGIERDENNTPVTNNGQYKVIGDYRFYRGDYNPDFQVGFINTVSYKQFSLDMVIDWRKGGTVIDATGGATTNNGYTTESLFGRDAEHGGITWIDEQGNVRDDGMILPGIDEKTGQANQVIIPAQDYYKSKYSFSTYPEFSTFTGTYVKMRQVSLSYRLPANLINTIPGIQNVALSLQGKNLFMWTKDNLKFDPESAFSSTAGTFAGGVNFEKYPVARSYGIKLNITF